MYSPIHGLTLGESSATVAGNSSHPIVDVQRSARRPLYTKDSLHNADDPVVASCPWYMLFIDMVSMALPYAHPRTNSASGVLSATRMSLDSIPA